MCSCWNSICNNIILIWYFYLVCKIFVGTYKFVAIVILVGIGFFVCCILMTMFHCGLMHWQNSHHTCVGERIGWCKINNYTDDAEKFFHASIVINYLFWAVFTIVRISWIISFCLFLSLDLIESTKQHPKWSSKSWRFTDLRSPTTARFCWITLMQYWSLSIIEMIFSNELLAFLSDMSIFSWFFFI